MISGNEWTNGTYANVRDPNTYLASSPLSMVRQFHTLMGQALDEKYVQISKLERLRLTLVPEEFDEICASETPDNLLQELADIVYVAYG